MNLDISGWSDDKANPGSVNMVAIALLAVRWHYSQDHSQKGKTKIQLYLLQVDERDQATFYHSIQTISGYEARTVGRFQLPRKL